MDKIDYFFIISIILLSFAFFFLLGLMFKEINIVSKLKYAKSQIDGENYDSCYNLSLIETSTCLNEFVKGIYKFNETEDSKYLTLDELIRDGGDCLDYTRFYQREFKRRNFQTYQVIIPMGSDGLFVYRHTFLIAYDETGYCHLDQKLIVCFEYSI